MILSMVQARIASAQHRWASVLKREWHLLGSIGLALIPSIVVGLPAQAQVQRHPKIIESRQAIATTLPDALPDILQREAYRVDPRSPDALETIQSFVTDWNVVSPNTALFLGEWSSASSNGATATWSIYPSYKSGGRVCVLRRRQSPNNDTVDYLFGVGHLVTPSAEANTDSDEFIYQLNVTGDGFSTAFQRVTTADVEAFLGEEAVDRQDTLLAEVTVNPIQDELVLGALSAFPQPLSEPDFGPASATRTTMETNYAAAGCTAELPQRREWGLEALTLTETQALETTPGANFRFDGAYVPVSDTGNSVEVYWTVNNQSDRKIAIQPLNIRVETSDAMPIDCPASTARFQELVGTDEISGCARGYLDPWQDGFLEPGDSVSGRVVILRRPEDLDNTVLIVPDSFTGGLEAFRVPIR